MLPSVTKVSIAAFSNVRLSLVAMCSIYGLYIFGPTPYWLSKGNTACVPKIRNITDSATLSWLVFTNKGPREREPLIFKLGVIFQWCFNALLLCVVWAAWAFRVKLSATF